MTIALAVVAGFLTGRLAWHLLHATFEQPLFERENYRGHRLPTAAGLVVPIALLLVEAGRAAAGAAGIGEAGAITGPRALTLSLALALGLLGAIDDLAGSGAERGFAGHLRALARGRLTTGGLKLVGGAAAAVVACAPVSGESIQGLARDALLVALAANLGNLFDRAPGRTLKVTTLAFVVVAALAPGRAALTGVAAAVGAGLGLLLDDLRERLMLGDAGANVLGGVCGFAVVLACGEGTRLVVLVAVAALNVLSERVSFSRVIESTGILRAADQLGRRPRGEPDR